MIRENITKKLTPFFNQNSDFDKVYDYEENLYNDPFCREKFDQTMKNDDVKRNDIFLKNPENERYSENY